MGLLTWIRYWYDLDTKTQILQELSQYERILVISNIV